MSKWEWKKLGEVAEIVGGSTPKTGVEEYWNGKNIWITPAEIGRDLFLNDSVRHISDAAVKSANLKLMPAGTVILSSRAPIGKLAISNVPFYCNQGFKNAICGDLLNNKFLFFYLLSSTAELESLGKGTTFKEISKTIVENIPVPVPPLSEQKHIVKFLDNEFSKIDTLKTNAETNLKNAKELFESTLEKELNPGKNGTLPSGWEWKTLRELCILRPSKNEALSHLKGTDEVSFLPMEDLNIRERNTIPHKSRALSEVHGSYTFFAEGDVLLAKVTPCFENGKMGVASNLLNGVGFGSSEYIVFRTTKSMINSYLFYVLMSSRFISGGKKQMLGACGLKRLSKEYVESFQIPLPPLSVQKEIVARLDKLSENVKRLEANYKQIIANCDELKKSILKKTFEGES